jgi:hypothetical protein
MEKYPKWLNNLIYFLAGIGVYGIMMATMSPESRSKQCNLLVEENKMLKDIIMKDQSKY